MANIRLLSWNIEVYGPSKYGLSPNNERIVRFVARTAESSAANIVVLQELMSSVAMQICFSIAEQISIYTGTAWSYVAIAARPDGDRESYGILWQAGGAPNFVMTSNGNSAQNVALSALQFPNGFSPTNGRRPAIATFRTTDTGVNFAVYDWHSVPRNPVPGLEQSARTTALYTVDNAGNQQAVTGRILAGDFNMAVTQPEFTWLTNPVPRQPPPAAAGEGAGTTSIIPSPPAQADYTHLGKIADAMAVWGLPFAGWSGDSVDYRDYQLDNSYYASPNVAPAPGGGPLDLVNQIATPGSPLRQIAQDFELTYPTGAPMFPNAALIPLPLAQNLTTMGCAFLLYRYGISDHLPVLNSVTI
jgi:endonuclease/exonuclease/phosphatase family metal-dependent hydrolase